MKYVLWYQPKDGSSNGRQTSWEKENHESIQPILELKSLQYPFDRWEIRDIE